MNCIDTFEKIYSELYKTISKYVEVIPEELDIKMTSSSIYIKLMGEDS